MIYPNIESYYTVVIPFYASRWFDKGEIIKGKDVHPELIEEGRLDTLDTCLDIYVSMDGLLEPFPFQLFW